jgi:hypothetical protein
MKASEMLHILKVQNKRLFIIWLVTFVAFIGLLGYTLWLLNDIGTIEETTTQEVSQENDNGNNNFIGNDGDIINGETESKTN